MVHTVERGRCPNGCRKAWRVYSEISYVSQFGKEFRTWALECKDCGYNA